jgi:hypothetical protein
LQKGAGTPTLMPTMPHWISRAKRRAAPPSLVKMTAPLP